MIIKKIFNAEVHVTAVGPNDADIEGDLYRQLLKWEVESNTISQTSEPIRQDTVVGIRLRLGEEFGEPTYEQTQMKNYIQYVNRVIECRDSKPLPYRVWRRMKHG